jgi:DNA-binding YbaB/EbfC family protein
MFNIPDLMGQFQKMKQDLDKAKESLSQKTTTTEVGGGMVIVVMSGDLKVLSITISDELIAMNDKAMLENLVASGVSKAIESTQEMMQSELGAMTNGMMPFLQGLKF